MTQIERLVKIYVDSRGRLLHEINKRLLWGRNIKHQEELLALIDRELRRLKLESYTWAQEAVDAAYMRGARIAYQAAYSADHSIRAFSSFGGLHKRAISLLAHNMQDYLTITNNLIARQAKDKVREIGVKMTSRKFAEGLTKNETRKGLMDMLQQESFYSVPWRNGKGSMRVDSYADLVARTTTAEATNTGTINQMDELGQYTVKMTEHNTTCKVCASRQGRVYRTADASVFPEGDPRRQLPHISQGMPRWPTYKTVHPNCFVSGTPILAQGVIAHSGRDYIGEIITITIAGGNKLTVTPNHPILTPEGWVKAGALLKGDKVVKYTRIDDFLVGKHPDDINVPTFIEQVPHALRKARGVSAYSVETTTEQFHGDGTNGKIAVIRSYGLLRRESETPVNEEIPKRQFIRGFEFCREFFTPRTFFQILNRAGHASDSIMGRAHTGLPFFWAKAVHGNLARFCSRWCRSIARFFQTQTDCHLTDLELLSYCGFSHPGLVHSDDLINRKRLSVRTRFGDNNRAQLSKTNTALSGALFNGSYADANKGRDLVDSLSGKIEFLDIVDVKCDSFHGKVYNLHTKNGWYLANGIITHNCAHRLIPFIWEQKPESTQKSTLDKAKEPFELDPRGEAERKRYEKAQRENAERMRDRKQWEKYRAALGADETPTFSGFRRMKSTESENYLDLLKKYRQRPAL